MKKNLEENGFRKFGMLDKVSYAAGDFGCNMSFALAGTWFTLFWTQYMKIDSIAFAGILVLLKVWDAINDPLIGTYMDASRKEYKLGKFKHFIFIGSFGLAAAACLCFLPVPNAPQIVKIIVCVVGYLLWDAMYTVVNVPYGSMLSVITSDPGQRAQLGAWRTLGSMAASIPIGMILPILLYDENNEIMGHRLFFVALVLGIIGFFAFLFMIKTTEERVDYRKNDDDKVKFNFLKSLKDFFHNRAALGATMVPVAMFLGMYGAMTATQVVFQTYFKNPALLGIISLVGMLPSILAIPFAKKLTERFGKKEASTYGLYLSLVACVVMCVIPMPPNNTGVMIFLVLQILNGLGQGIGMCLGNAMMADAIDYNEWKTGKREEGVTYSLHSFFRKVAQGIGPSIGLVLMVMLGYNEQLGAQQPFEVALKLRYLVAVLYLVSIILMYVGVKFIFNLDKKTLDQMNRELGR